MISKLTKPTLPEVKFNRNGYEIRTDILSMAKDFVQSDFQTKMWGWEVTSERTSSGQLLTKVSMPEYPGLDKILDAAEKMYAFVSESGKSVPNK